MHTSGAGPAGQADSGSLCGFVPDGVWQDRENHSPFEFNLRKQLGGGSRPQRFAPPRIIFLSKVSILTSVVAV